MATLGFICLFNICFHICYLTCLHINPEIKGRLIRLPARKRRWEGWGGDDVRVPLLPVQFLMMCTVLG